MRKVQRISARLYRFNGCLIYQSEGLWWAKNEVTGSIVDAAPTKAELLRSLEVIFEG